LENEVPLWAQLVISALFSGVAASAITIFLQNRMFKRQTKLDCLRRFAAHRYDILGDNFSAAMNEIIITFSDSTEVMAARERLWEKLNARTGGANDELVKLIKAMAKDAGVRISEKNDSFFLATFNTRG
jgi:hypothetical protein